MYYKMTVREKIKTSDNKREQNKARHDLERQTVKITVLLSGNVSKSEFLTGKDALREKDLLEKAATMKRFEYSLLGSELKKQTCIAEKQYKRLDKDYELDKNGYERIKKEKPIDQSFSPESKYQFFFPHIIII